MNIDKFGTELEIDLTNLLDLMVILTAALMLTISPISVLSTKLPEVNSNRSVLDPRTSIMVSFSKSQDLTWNNEPITWKELERNVQNHSHKKETPEILLAGDAGASYGFSVRIRALLTKHGLKVKELTKCERNK